MAITSTDRRRTLRGIYKAALNNGVSLATQLETERDAAEALVSTGARTIQSVTGNGLATTFADDGAAGMQPVDRARMIEEIIDTVDDANASLTTPTDAELFAEAMHRLRGVTEVRSSFTSLTMS